MDVGYCTIAAKTQCSIDLFMYMLVTVSSLFFLKFNKLIII